jgi:hypothetical protein
MDSLMASGTKKRMRKQLSKLPEELATTYDQTMARINSQKAYFFDLAYHTLSWIANAYRPLKLVELRHAFATELGNTNFDNEGLPGDDDLTSCCAGLVVYEPVDSPSASCSTRLRNIFVTNAVSLGFLMRSLISRENA